MPRQRHSRFAQGPSEMDSSSGASFHTAHQNRRSMYPGMQARASDAEDSEPPRRARRLFSGILESDHGSQTSESNSGYGSSTRRSHDPSQASMSDPSLEPWDSISNQDSNPSENGNFPRNPSPRGNSSTLGHYACGEY